MSTSTQTNQKHTKAIATVTALALLATGTFAWQSFDQVALNETKLLVENAGVRLHDDFDGVNKDVYVENYTTYEDDGQLVYGRIRLDEYLEIGKGSGSGAVSESIRVIRGDKAKGEDVTPDINDVDTWDTYLFGSEAVDGEESIRTYRDLEFGGQTVYMPTFNKNKDSLAPDINGTLEGPDGDMDTWEDDYKDYKEYTLGEILEGTAIYDMDENTVDEGDASEKDVNHYEVVETHEAKATLDATVISMATWQGYTDEEKENGPYWIYDTDGWAYWSQAMEPETATGLLLTGIVESQDISDPWYYSINVVGMFATAGDWGDKEAGTGMYGDITDDALELLNKVSDIMKLSKIAVKKADDSAFTVADTEIAVGEALELTSDVVIQHGVGREEETAVTWEVLDDQGAPVQGVAVLDEETGVMTLNPTQDMVGNTYIIKITSEFDQSKSSQVEITIYDPNEVSIDVYAVNGDTTVKAGGSVEYAADVEGVTNKSVAWSVSGNASENTTINNAGKLTVGADESSNRALTVTASPVVRPETTDTVGVQTETQKITVTTTDGATKVKPGNTQAFTVQVDGMINQAVDWSVTKGTTGAAVASGTSVSASGLLTVSSSESTGSTLRVKATSQGNPSISGYLDISVPESYDDYVGTDNTITIDGVSWYVIDSTTYNGQDMVKIFMANTGVITNTVFGSTNAWTASTIRNTTLPNWLNGKSTLKSMVVCDHPDNGKSTYTPALTPDTSGASYVDSIFLLSEYEYTNLLSSEQRKASATWWLRTPSSSYVRGVSTNGNLRLDTATVASGVRPALWIYQ